MFNFLYYIYKLLNSFTLNIIFSIDFDLIVNRAVLLKIENFLSRCYQKPPNIQIYTGFFLLIVFYFNKYFISSY